jgi:hypothetical protein
MPQSVRNDGLDDVRREPGGGNLASGDFRNCCDQRYHGYLLKNRVLLKQDGRGAPV